MFKLKEIANAKWEIEKDAKPGMNVPVRIYGISSLVEAMHRDRTYEQATNVASLPGIIDRAFVMPDGHEGFPEGP